MLHSYIICYIVILYGVSLAPEIRAHGQSLDLSYADVTIMFSSSSSSRIIIIVIIISSSSRIVIIIIIIIR